MDKQTQIEAILFRNKKGPEFLLLKRNSKRGGFWQPITGELEPTDSSLLEAALMEVFEETKITKKEIIRIIKEVHYFEFKEERKGKEILIKEHVFAFEISPNIEPIISKEHEEYCWVNIANAIKLLKWDSNKEAFHRLVKILNSSDKKINKNKAVTLIKEFIKNSLSKEEWYQNIKPHIKAIILYGSVAKGTNCQNSDIDFLIILPLEIEKKYTKGEYVYHYKNQEINIVLRSIERLRKLAKSKKDNFQAEVFMDSEIIWEKDNEVKGLIKKKK